MQIANTVFSTTIKAATDPLPVGTGGAVADGLYFLTEALKYPGSALPSVEIKQTLEICAGVGHLSENIGGFATSTHKNFTITPSGAVPNFAMTCSTKQGDTETPFSSYAATATRFTLYSTAVKFQETFTKQ